MGRRVLVARADNLGDVLLTGPAVRAIAAAGAAVHYLCSPQGRPAAECLPGVGGVTETRLAWIDADPPPVSRRGVERLVDEVAALRVDEALIFTSFHQSPLPLALVLRMAAVGRISAISVDYPGTLLDVRHRVDEDLHEVERTLSLAGAAGFALPPGDDRRLRIAPRPGGSRFPWAGRPYVVVHPGASVPARTWPAARFADLVAALTGQAVDVVVTGSRSEAALAASVAGSGTPGRVLDRAGRTDFAGLAAIIDGAAAVVCGNTGPAHLAAAVGTPVVSIYAPTVPASRWHPWMTPHVLLGRQDIGCAGCRARVCPVEGHPCIADIPVAAVVDAVHTVGRGAIGGHRWGTGSAVPSLSDRPAGVSA